MQSTYLNKQFSELMFKIAQKRKFTIALLAILSVVWSPVTVSALPVCATNFPSGVGFIGLAQDTSEWQIYLSADRDSGWQEINTELEPRTFQFSLTRNEMLYLASKNSISSYKLDDGSEQELASANDLLRQPSLAIDSSVYYAVRFTENKSSDTELVVVPHHSPGSSEPIGQQPGAMFSPVLDIRNQWLLYTIAHCTKGCGRIIQEVWRKDLSNGRSDQLTLLGEMSSDPVGDSQSGIIYFSHVFEGRESVLKYHVESRQIEETYKPGSINRHPALTKNGDLFFLSVFDNKPAIVKYNATTNVPCLFNLPDSIVAARELVADRF